MYPEAKPERSVQKPKRTGVDTSRMREVFGPPVDAGTDIDPRWRSWERFECGCELVLLTPSDWRVWESCGPSEARHPALHDFHLLAGEETAWPPQEPRERGFDSNQARIEIIERVRNQNVRDVSDAGAAGAFYRKGKLRASILLDDRGKLRITKNRDDGTQSDEVRPRFGRYSEVDIANAVDAIIAHLQDPLD
jgi:hypothetical protein